MEPTTQLPFDDESFVTDVEARLEQFIQEDQLTETRALVINLQDFNRSHPEFARQNPSLHERCVHMQIRASWVAFSTLEERDAIELIKNSLSTVFTLPFFNLQEKFRGYIVGVLLLEDRDRVKQLFRKAMLENNEFLPVTITSAPSPTHLTIGAWLNQYNQYTGGKISTSIQRAQFLLRPLSEPLTEQQKEQLRGIITAFDWLKLSSVNLESDAEVMSVDIEGQPAVYRAGRIEDIKVNPDLHEKLRKMGFLKPEEGEPLATAPAASNSLPVVTPTTLVNSLPSKGAAKALSTTPAKMPTSPVSLTPPPLTSSAPTTTNAIGSPSVLMSSDINFAAEKVASLPAPELLANFYQALTEKSYNRTMGLLKVMASNGLILELLKKEPRFAEALANYYRQQQRTAEADSLKLSLTDPQHLKEFIKIVLENQLKIKSGAAAHVASDLVNLINASTTDKTSAKLAHWSYFDMATNEYKWL